MKETSKAIPAIAFQGRWIGETQGCETLAHRWEIAIFGTQVTITCSWEGEPIAGSFYGTLIPYEPAFDLDTHKATLIDSEHFVIERWVGPCVGDDESLGIIYFDVIFSRPGLAELTNASAYRKWKVSLVSA